jgi:hypothetical protein
VVESAEQPLNTADDFRNTRAHRHARARQSVPSSRLHKQRGQAIVTLTDGEALLQGLRQARGHGRDDYPVATRWAVVLTVALRHLSFTACIDELRRNPTLDRLLGMTSVADIPNDWNISRFVEVLGQEPHLTEFRKVFDVLAQRLGRAGNRHLWRCGQLLRSEDDGPEAEQDVDAQQ